MLDGTTSVVSCELRMFRETSYGNSEYIGTDRDPSIEYQAQLEIIEIGYGSDR